MKTQRTLHFLALWGWLLLFVSIAGCGNENTTGPGEVEAKIAFVSDRDGNSEIYNSEVYVMDTDGANPIQLTETDSASYERIAWSPDGTQIAFVKNKLVGSVVITDIFVMNADGANLINLTNSPGYENGPAWSPDGSRIAFTSHDGIFSIKPDGTDLTLLTTEGGSPLWSPK